MMNFASLRRLTSAIARQRSNRKNNASRSAAACRRQRTFPLVVILAAIQPLSASCGESNVTAVEADCDQTTCNFSVTVQHEDSGWDHYADHWRVLDANGAELGRRVLLHPHVNEQPFTRRLNDVVIGSDINRVVIESHDSVHGYGGATLEVGLQR